MSFFSDRQFAHQKADNKFKPFFNFACFSHISCTREIGGRIIFLYYIKDSVADIKEY